VKTPERFIEDQTRKKKRKKKEKQSAVMMMIDKIAEVSRF